MLAMLSLVLVSASWATFACKIVSFRRLRDATTLVFVFKGRHIPRSKLEIILGADKRIMSMIKESHTGNFRNLFCLNKIRFVRVCVCVHSVVQELKL